MSTRTILDRASKNAICYLESGGGGPRCSKMFQRLYTLHIVLLFSFPVGSGDSENGNGNGITSLKINKQMPNAYPWSS